MSTTIRFALKLLGGIALFAGLPWVGWGVMDTPGFVSHPARLGYVVVVALLQLFVLLRFPEMGVHGNEGQKTVRRQRFAVLLMQILALAIALAAPYSDRRDVIVLNAAEVVRYFGLALFAFGFITLNWAAASLGKQFSIQVTLQADHQLVTGGPYQYLRHPRYLSVILYNVGIALVYRSGLALILTTALTLVLLWRIHDEEAFMHQAFGAEWEAYAQRSWRLIPLVY